MAQRKSLQEGATSVSDNKGTRSCYEQLLTGWRIRPTTQPNRSLAVEAESDRGRVLFSSAFRCLRQKTQVFALEGNASIRTRLTHSLEVAQVGRYLTQLVLEQMNASDLLRAAVGGKEEAIQTFVETSCLVHDLGNPPYGHFGERAIRHWFEENERELMKSWYKSLAHKDKASATTFFLDFLNFDGNPQGFRVLSKLIWNSDQHGLNLTGTQLAATMKYVCEPSGIVKKDKLRKKAGFFHSEFNIAKTITKELGIREGARHPLVYLMEAADDIAYGLSDLEDAIEKGLFNEDEILARIAQEFEASPLGSREDLKWFSDLLTNRTEDISDVPGRKLLAFRTGVVNKMVKLSANIFVTNHERYIIGHAEPLLDSVPEAVVLTQLNNIAKKYIYQSRVVMKSEIIGSKVIKGILDAYKPIMLMPVERFEAARNGDDLDNNGKQLSTENSLIQQIPLSLFRAYDYQVKQEGESKDARALWEPFCRMHLIVDFLSGMTDQFSLKFFQLLNAGGGYEAS